MAAGRDLMRVHRLRTAVRTLGVRGADPGHLGDVTPASPGEDPQDSDGRRIVARPGAASRRARAEQGLGARSGVVADPARPLLPGPAVDRSGHGRDGARRARRRAPIAAPLDLLPDLPVGPDHDPPLAAAAAPGIDRRQARRGPHRARAGAQVPARRSPLLRHRQPVDRGRRRLAESRSVPPFPVHDGTLVVLGLRGLQRYRDRRGRAHGLSRPRELRSSVSQSEPRRVLAPLAHHAFGMDPVAGVPQAQRPPPFDEADLRGGGGVDVVVRGVAWATGGLLDLGPLARPGRGHGPCPGRLRAAASEAAGHPRRRIHHRGLDWVHLRLGQSRLAPLLPRNRPGVACRPPGRGRFPPCAWTNPLADSHGRRVRALSWRSRGDSRLETRATRTAAGNGLRARARRRVRVGLASLRVLPVLMARGEIRPEGLPDRSTSAPRLPILGRAALAGFVVTVMALELVSRSIIAPLTMRGGFEQFSALVAEIRNSGHSPVILFLGTSHVQCAILPAVIERRLGLQRGAVLNAGLGASAPYEQMRLYTAVGEYLGGARLAVLETTPLYFNRSLANNARVRLDLDTRLHYPAEMSKRADWLAGWAFSTWDRRRTWRAVATRAVRSAFDHAGLEWPVFDPDGYPGIPGAPSARGQLAMDADRAGLDLFERYSFDEEAVREFTALLARIRGHGTRVVLLEYPLF